MAKPKDDPEVELARLRGTLHAFFNVYPPKELKVLRDLLYGAAPAPAGDTVIPEGGSR
jgi:hypothetical protein